MDKKRMKTRFLKGIDRRLAALYGENPLPYTLTDGHWIRDLITMRAFLLNQDGTEKLINNLPE